MVGEEAANVLCQRVGEMPARRRLPAAEHGVDPPQLRPQLVEKRTVDQSGPQRGAVGVVLARLESAQDEVAQFGEGGQLPQRRERAARRSARAARLDQAAKGVHQVGARRQHARDQRAADVAESHHDQPDGSRSLHAISELPGGRAPLRSHGRGSAPAVPLSFPARMR